MSQIVKSWGLESCLQKEDFLTLNNGPKSQYWRAAHGISLTLLAVSLSRHCSYWGSPAVSPALIHMRGICNSNFQVVKDELITYQRLAWSPEGDDLLLLKILRVSNYFLIVQLLSYFNDHCWPWIFTDLVIYHSLRDSGQTSMVRGTQGWREVKDNDSCQEDNIGL